MTRTKLTIVVGALACAVLFTSTGAVRAADHGDSPQVRVDTRADINDVYLFQSPENASNTVMIMTVCPLAGTVAPKEFTPQVKYEFAVDTDGDAKPNQIYRIVFAKPDKTAAHAQKFTLTGPNRLKVRGVTGDTGIPAGLGGKVFAGVRDDPFFFDLIGFKRGLSFSSTTSRNFFDGLNTMSIVLEVPTSSFSATSIGVWARTVKGQRQIDRMGRPAINTALIPGAKKDQFNSASPDRDVADFKADVVASLLALVPARTNADALANILLPDILTYDTTNSAGFLNGRKLSDDVIDAELALLSENAITTDFVANDSTFLTAFPYLGVANP